MLGTHCLQTLRSGPQTWSSYGGGSALATRPARDRSGDPGAGGSRWCLQAPAWTPPSLKASPWVGSQTFLSLPLPLHRPLPERGQSRASPGGPSWPQPPPAGADKGEPSLGTSAADGVCSQEGRRPAETPAATLMMQTEGLLQAGTPFHKAALLFLVATQGSPSRLRPPPCSVFRPLPPPCCNSRIRHGPRPALVPTC